MKKLLKAALASTAAQAVMKYVVPKVEQWYARRKNK